MSKEFGKVREPIDSQTGHGSCIRIKNVDAQQSHIWRCREGRERGWF